jgi:hypothetical protein
LTQSGLNDFNDGFLENIETFENIKISFSNNKKICDVVNCILNILNPQENTINKNSSNKEKNLIEEIPSNTHNVNLLGNFTDLKNSNQTDINISSNNNIFEIFTPPINQKNTEKSSQLINLGNQNEDDREQKNVIKPQQFSFVKKSNLTNNLPSEGTNGLISNLSNKNSEKLVEVFAEMSIKSPHENIPTSELAPPNTKTFGFIKTKSNPSTIENVTPVYNFKNKDSQIPTVDLTKSIFFLIRFKF